MKVDDAIRDPEPMTEDQKLLDAPSDAVTIDFRRSEAWRVMRMTSELVEGLDTLGDVKRAVTIFGVTGLTRSWKLRGNQWVE